MYIVGVSDVMKDTWAAANRMGATDRVRYETSQYHDHRVVPGVFDRLLEELVFCVCLLRGPQMDHAWTMV